jgi:hypothetical protein
MKFPSFFRAPSHRVFDMKPRYYDPEKERSEQLEGQGDRIAEQAKANIRYHFSNRKKNLDMASARQSLIRIALIACFLSLLIFWLFK